MLKMYYLVPGEDHGLILNQRVRVELTLKTNDPAKHVPIPLSVPPLPGDLGTARRFPYALRRKVVPYEAVYYDGHGATWVYTQIHREDDFSTNHLLADDRLFADAA